MESWKIGETVRTSRTEKGRNIGTWTTSEPVSWQASDAHFPFKDLLTLRWNHRQFGTVEAERSCSEHSEHLTYYAKMGGAGGVQDNSIIYDHGKWRRLSRKPMIEAGSNTIRMLTLLQTCDACLFTRVCAGSPTRSSETISKRMSSSQSRAFWRTWHP